MIRPVYQTIIDPERGDCERACVATILGCAIEDVPNFSEPGLPPESWMPMWLQSVGWCLIETKRPTTPRDVSYLGLNGIVGIGTVPSQAFPGGRHAVVIGWRPHPEHPESALECYIVHDPNPNNAPYENVTELVERVRWMVPKFRCAQ